MAVNPWKASSDIAELLNTVKEKHHAPRLAQASVAVCFDDSKPFVHNKLNLGKVFKFNELNKLWQIAKHDFCIVICSDVWYSLLRDPQREALLDLQLTRCEVQYLPVTQEVNKKKKVVKDEWGRIQYTQDVKLNEAGEPIWRILPLDLDVFAKNVRRYGLWFDDLVDLKQAIAGARESTVEPDVPVLV